MLVRNNGMTELGSIQGKQVNKKMTHTKGERARKKFYKICTGVKKETTMSQSVTDIFVL